MIRGKRRRWPAPLPAGAAALRCRGRPKAVVKRLLFDTGSILTALSPLILAAYFITQGGGRVDTAGVIVETSELRPAITEVSEAAEAARLSGDTGPLLQAIDDLYVLRDSAAEGALMVLPEGAGGPLLSELNVALDEFTGSVAAFTTTAGDGNPSTAAELRAGDALDELLSTLSVAARDSVVDGRVGRDRALVLTMLGLGMTTVVILLWRRRARRAVNRSERASRTIRQMASQTDRAERRVRELSDYDALTGLTSRARFVEELHRAVEHARQRNRSVAVVMLDLNRFKLINDALGHASGDRLLSAVARRLQKQLSSTDTVARFGGDEFVAMLTGLKRENAAAGYAAAGVAGRLQQALRQPFDHDGEELLISASIGMSVLPGRARDAEELLRQASAALYRAKERGSNAISFYDPREENPIEGRLALESELRRAIEREEFELYYQPQVDMQSSQILGVEALIRWLHPRRGLVLPNDFVPLLEEMGEIVPVGRWAIERACADAQAWTADGLPPVRVAINLSVHQFLDPELVPALSRTIQRTGIDPARLELEITETIAMKNVEPAVEILTQLHELGVMTALDDFGTGYSSLGRLNEFPVHTLKIDRSFVASLTARAGDQAIVKGVIALGHAMELRVVAEGIETDLQAHILRTLGTDLAQGFAYSEPVDEPSMRKLLREGIDPKRMLAAS